MLNSIAQYNFYSGQIKKLTTAVATRPEIKRETQYYLANIGKVHTIDEFMKNDRLLRFALKAYGLDSMANSKAFIRKALSEGIDSSTSFANKLNDNRFRDFVGAFNFVRYGEAATVFDSAQQVAVDKYLRQTIETDAGSQSEAVQLALYFERNASNVSSSYSLLADAALLKVTQVALGLPSSTSALPVDRQSELISRKLNIEDLKNPAKLKQFLTRFLSRWDLENQTVTTPLDSISVGSTIGQIDISSLTALQRLRRGGN